MDRNLQGGERGGFTGIFEIVAADKARVGRVKRRPLCAGNVDCRPYQPLSHPCCPIYPRIPCLTQGANWGRQRYTSTIRPANDPPPTPPARVTQAGPLNRKTTRLTSSHLLTSN